jgi:hypothetical protein
VAARSRRETNAEPNSSETACSNRRGATDERFGGECRIGALRSPNVVKIQSVAPEDFEMRRPSPTPGPSPPARRCAWPRCSRSTAARSPLAQERLELHPSGKLRYSLKKAWSDGSVAVIFEPEDLLSGLCVIIPPPRFHIGDRP